MSEQLERIEKYLSGQMESAEKLDFENELQRDPKLKSAFDQFKVIHDALEVEVEDNLRNQLIELASRNKPLNQRRNWRLPYALALAASVLILLVAGTWWYLGKSLNDPALYAANEYVEYTRTNLRAEEPNRSYSDVFDFLNRQDSAAAIARLQQRINASPDDTEARFLLADLLYRSGKWQEAGALFLQITQGKSVLWGEKAAWNYLVLAQQNIWNQDAEDILKSILSNTNHSYHPKALKLEKIRQ
ncbi:MAG: tetratricopeptide repeat protein [Saprospiraceae bacterium]|nr:tetratricopeptide repeat protein [Saprospiraceae bacterium]